MDAKCLGLSYHEGGFRLRQGIKGGGVPGNDVIRGGVIQAQQGNGWAKEIAPSRLVLTVDVGGAYHHVYVDRFFKDSVGRLTVKRRAKLAENIPETIAVDEFESVNGTKFYVAKEEDLIRWKENAGL